MDGQRCWHINCNNGSAKSPLELNCALISFRFIGFGSANLAMAHSSKVKSLLPIAKDVSGSTRSNSDFSNV